MNVLIIAAHPDDEVLGVGGTIAKHTVAGDRVELMIIAEGATSRMDGSQEDVADLRRATDGAAGILGAQEPIFLGLPDNRLDSLDLLDVIQCIENKANEIPYKPDIVYTHHGGDLNLDHRIVHQAVVTAFRPMPGSSVKSIFGFETLSSTEWSFNSVGETFSPNRFVDISKTLETKCKALECYSMEMRDFPHPRSIKAIKSLAWFRGSHVGVEAAEAFEVVFDIS